MQLQISYTVMKSAITLYADQETTNDFCVHVENLDQNPVPDGHSFTVYAQVPDRPPALTSEMVVGGLAAGDITEQWFTVEVEAGVSGPYIIYTSDTSAPNTAFQVTAAPDQSGTWPIPGIDTSKNMSADTFQPMALTIPGQQAWPNANSPISGDVYWRFDAEDGRPYAQLKLNFLANYVIQGGVGKFPKTLNITVQDWWPQGRDNSCTMVNFTRAELVTSAPAEFGLEVDLRVWWWHLGEAFGLQTGHVTISEQGLDCAWES